LVGDSKAFRKPIVYISLTLIFVVFLRKYVMINKNTQIKGRMFLLKNKKPLTTKNALEVFEEKMENPKYCTKEIGRLLYSDKLLAVERFEKIDEVIRRYSDNKKHNKTILNELNTYKRQGIISNVLSIDKFLYSKEYLDFLNNLPKNRDDVYYMCNGLTDVGYVEFSNNYNILKDLRISPEATIIKKDIINPIIGYEKAPIRKLSYKDSEFMSSINFDNKENILLLGADLGYLLFLLKENKKVKNLYIHDTNSSLLHFINENILKHIETDINLHLLDEDLEDLEPFKLNTNLDLIVISSMIDIQEQMKYYYKLKLFNYEYILRTNIRKIMFNKYKQDLQDIIMTNKDDVINILLSTYKDTKGLSSATLGLQLDFAEKSELYLDKNNIFFDNYKKYQKFINKDSVILDILRM